MILNSPVSVVIPDSENGAALTSIQEQVPNQSKSEKLINKGCTSLHLPSTKYGNQPLPRGPSNYLSHFSSTSSCREPCDVPELVQKLQVHSLQATYSDYPRVTICSICLIKFFTSLWLPPFFSFCRFSLAGIVCFSHSWRGPSSELPGHCRLSARFPQHTGKNGAFPLLWSSSFFKCFHSILKETNQTNTNSMFVSILFYHMCTNIMFCDVGLHKYSSCAPL